MPGSNLWFAPLLVLTLCEYTTDTWHEDWRQKEKWGLDRGWTSLIPHKLSLRPASTPRLQRAPVALVAQPLGLSCMVWKPWRETCGLVWHWHLGSLFSYQSLKGACAFLHQRLRDIEDMTVCSVLALQALSSAKGSSHLAPDMWRPGSAFSPASLFPHWAPSQVTSWLFLSRHPFKMLPLWQVTPPPIHVGIYFS